MLPIIQREFAEKFKDQDIEILRLEISRQLDCPIEFKISEMPIFVSKEFKLKLEQYSIELLHQCSSDKYLENTKQLLQDKYIVPNQSKKPLFSVVDFAVTKDPISGEYEPKLVELQGFPSLFGYQHFYANAAKNFYSLPEKFSSYFSSLQNGNFIELLRNSICGKYTSEEVVLLELRPEEQKTKPDFYALEKLIGIKSINIEELIVQEKQLFYENNGKKIQIKRIFNRTIIDELEQQNASIPIQWNTDYDVEWAGHPNWYFLISKYSLPFFDHISVPKSYFLNTIETMEVDFTKFVLKPLFSFAGRGVIINPTEQDVSIIPIEERKNYIIQEKIKYDPCIYTPFGMNKVEIRVMLIWLPEWENPLPVSSLTRSGSGEMMGVRYNTLPWTGSAGCFFES